MLEYYQDTAPEAAIVSRTASFAEGANILSPLAKFYSYLILGGRRIASCAKASWAPNSIIQTEFDGEIFAGQVIGLFTHKQNHIPGPQIFLHV